MNASTFVNRLVETLNEENASRIGTEQSLLNVPFMVAAVAQHIGEPQYETFLSELDDDVHMRFEEREPDDYYTNGKVLVFVNDGVYYLTFAIDERMWGYCMCTPDLQGYNHQHRCCGHGCDWRAPAFYVDKEINIGQSKWSGDASDYWRYEEDMKLRIEASNAIVAAEERKRKAEYLRSEIVRLQSELAEVEQ